MEMEDTIAQVERAFQSEKLSCMPVLDSAGLVFGIISSTDIALIHREGKNPAAVKAWEACTHKPIQVNHDATIEQVGWLMLRHEIHHILITANGLVVGIVTSLDLVQAFLRPGTDQSTLADPGVSKPGRGTRPGRRPGRPLTLI